MYAASLGDTFRYLQRMFSTSRMSGKVQIAKHIFHVQVEVGFWKFEYFQFHFILTARLDPTFLGPNCFQNIKYHSKNMRNLFCKVQRYFLIASVTSFDAYNVRKCRKHISLDLKIPMSRWKEKGLMCALKWQKTSFFK